MKNCSNKTCKNPRKPESEFNRDSQNSDGLHRQCKDCRREYRQLPKSLLRQKNYIANNWESNLLRSAYASSIGRGYDKPTLTVENIKRLFESQRGLCYWTGIQMVPTIEPRNLYQPSLDRLDGGIGYHSGNVVLCSWAANCARGASTEEEFTKWLSSIDYTRIRAKLNTVTNIQKDNT